jgi:hypothetical protein
MAASTLSRETIVDLLRRLGLAQPDDALVVRAMDLNRAGAEQLARLPHDFSKDVEPAHVFSVPLN